MNTSYAHAGEHAVHCSGIELVDQLKYPFAQGGVGFQRHESFEDNDAGLAVVVGVYHRRRKAAVFRRCE